MAAAAGAGPTTGAARPTQRFYVVATAETKSERRAAVTNSAGSLLDEIPMPRQKVEALFKALLAKLPAGQTLSTDSLRGEHGLGYLLSRTAGMQAKAGESATAHQTRLETAVWPKLWADAADKTLLRHKGLAREGRTAGAGEYRWQIKRSRLEQRRRTDRESPAKSITRGQAVARLRELWRAVCLVPRQLRELLFPMTRYQAWAGMAADMPAFGGGKFLEDGHVRGDGYASLPPEFFTISALTDPRWRAEVAGHVGAAAAADNVDTAYFIFKFRPELAEAVPLLPGQEESGQDDETEDEADTEAEVQDEAQDEVEAEEADDLDENAGQADFAPGAAEIAAAVAAEGAATQPWEDVEAELSLEELMPTGNEASTLNAQDGSGWLGGALNGGESSGGGDNDGTGSDDSTDSDSDLAGGARTKITAAQQAAQQAASDAWAYRKVAAGVPADRDSFTSTLVPTETRVSAVLRGHGTGTWATHKRFGGRTMWDVAAPAQGGNTGVVVRRQELVRGVLQDGITLYETALQRVNSLPEAHTLKALHPFWTASAPFLRGLQGLFMSHKLVVVPFQELARIYAGSRHKALRKQWVKQITTSCLLRGDSHNRVISMDDAQRLVDAESWLYNRGKTDYSDNAAFDSAFAVVDWSVPVGPVIRGYSWCRDGNHHTPLMSFSLQSNSSSTGTAAVVGRGAGVDPVEALPYVLPGVSPSAAVMRNNLYLEQLCMATAAVDGSRELPPGLGMLLAVWTFARRSTAPYAGLALEVVWATPALKEEGDQSWPSIGRNPQRLLLPDPRVLSLYADVLGFRRTFHIDNDDVDAIAKYGRTAKKDVSRMLSVFHVGRAAHPPYERSFVSEPGELARTLGWRLLVPGSTAVKTLKGDHSTRDKAVQSYLMYQPFPLPGTLVQTLALVLERTERVGSVIRDMDALRTASARAAFFSVALAGGGSSSGEEADFEGPDDDAPAIRVSDSPVRASRRSESMSQLTALEQTASGSALRQSRALLGDGVERPRDPKLRAERDEDVFGDGGGADGGADGGAEEDDSKDDSRDDSQDAHSKCSSCGDSVVTCSSCGGRRDRTGTTVPTSARLAAIDEADDVSVDDRTSRGASSPDVEFDD